MAREVRRGVTDVDIQHKSKYVVMRVCMQCSFQYIHYLPFYVTDVLSIVERPELVRVVTEHDPTNS